MERIQYKMTAIFGILILLLTACGQSQETQWQEQYDLGVRYLSEGNYEEAIIAFTAAIEIDPKQAGAYLKSAEAYVAMGDVERAIAILERGYEVTGEEALLEQKEKFSAPAQTVETYSVQTKMLTDGMDVTGENFSVQFRDNRAVTITISGLSLRDSYVINLPDSEPDATEYDWKVEMYGEQEAYSVSTTSWAFQPGANETVALEDMQHSVWRYDDDLWPLIGDASMTHTGDSITWIFTIPEEYPFDFTLVKQYKVRIFDVAQGVDILRVYDTE